jgi:hypothetical protein
MRQMGHIHDRFVVHDVLSHCAPRASPQRAAGEGVLCQSASRARRKAV